MPAWKESESLEWLHESLSSRIVALGRSFIFSLFLLVVVLAVALINGSLETTAALASHRLPYRDPGRLMLVPGPFLYHRNDVLDRLFLTLQQESKSVETISPFRWERVGLWLDGRGFEPLFALRVSPNFFHTLGVSTQLGRATIAPGEDPNGTVILSHAFWRTQFRGNPAIIGRKISIDSVECTIIGVLPSSFWFLSKDVQVWLPCTYQSTKQQKSSIFYNAIARLTPHANRQEAERELRAIADKHKMHFFVQLIPLEQALLQDLSTGFGILLAAFGLIVVAFGASLTKILLRRGEQKRTRTEIRYSLFLLFKSLPAAIALGIAWIVMVHPARQIAPEENTIFSMPILLWIFVLLCFGFVYWSLLDQRYRCRVCLQRLRMPVPTGSWSTPLLNRPGTEYICPFGHGKLIVSEASLFGMEPASWTYYGDFWEELVHPGHSTDTTGTDN